MVAVDGSEILILAVVMVNMPGYTGLHIIHINWDRIAFSNFNDSMILFFQRWGISISHRIHTWSTCLHLPYKFALHVGQRYGVLVVQIPGSNGVTKFWELRISVRQVRTMVSEIPGSQEH